MGLFKKKLTAIIIVGDGYFFIEELGEKALELLQAFIDEAKYSKKLEKYRQYTLLDIIKYCFENHCGFQFIKKDPIITTSDYYYEVDAEGNIKEGR